MPGIGTDIQEVLEELGKRINVYKHDTQTTISGEFIDTEQNISEDSPFESEHFVMITASYDSSITPGDRVEFVNIGDYYLAASLVDRLFEHDIYAKEGVLYKTNVSIDAERRSGEARDPQSYELVPNWEPVFSGELGLFSGRLSDHDIADERYGRFYQSSRKLFISNDLDLQIEDRCVIDDERYSVETMETHRLPGLKICGLAEDNRE